MTNPNNSNMKTFNYSHAAYTRESMNADTDRSAHGIRFYHCNGNASRDVRFFGTSTPDTSLTYGVEIETTDYPRAFTAEKMARFLHTKYSDRLHCERDSSIDGADGEQGVEVVSEAATLSYHM